MLALDPPGTVSVVSEKLPLNSDVTVAPVGDVVSSLIAANVAVPDATGASFTAFTVTLNELVTCCAPPVPALP